MRRLVAALMLCAVLGCAKNPTKPDVYQQGGESIGKPPPDPRGDCVLCRGRR